MINIAGINLDIALKYPGYPIRLQKLEGQTKVFDPVRKAWFVLSPEEFVRQHVINYLCVHKAVPSGMISVEKQVELNGQLKRYDLVIYKNSLPCLVVECKAPYIALSPEVAEQALRYNLILKAPYLMISNGLQDLIYKEGSLIKELTVYSEW